MYAPGVVQGGNVIDLDAILASADAKRSSRPFWLRWRSQGWNRNRVARTIGHLSDEEVRSLRRRAIEMCHEHGVDPYPRKKKRKRGKKIKATAPEQEKSIVDSVESAQSGGVWTINSTGRIHTLDQLMERANVDQKRWYVETWRANAYEAQRSGGGIVQLWQVKASLRERPEWMWKPVQPRKKFKKVTLTKPEVTLVIPDSQNGYRWIKNHQRLEPLHDRRAWDVAVQVAAQIKPDRIVLLGDMVDFAEGSKRWPVTPDLRATTQPTIDELYWWMLKLREECPDAHIDYLEGNHEDRIDRAMVSHMPELSSLRAALDSTPLVTWRRLLALDSLGIHYTGPYGESVALYDDCEASHGTTVASGGGATVARVLKGSHVSKVFGHIHRREYACRTIHDTKGHRVIFAVSPGTLCRVDGAVPAASKRVDWQQGLAILVNDGNRTSCQLIPIDDGIAYIHGQRVVGRDPGVFIARDTDWPQLA